MTKTDRSWLYEAPEPENLQESRGFTLLTAKGTPVEREFTIRTGGHQQAELFYNLIATSSKAAMDCQPGPGGKVAGVHFYPTPDSDIHVTNGGYLASLYVLAQVLVEPALTLDELALVGHKYGRSFDAVLDWASEVNGVTDYILEKWIAAIKNEQGVAGEESAGRKPVNR